jgi:hypothetical protein
LVQDENLDRIKQESFLSKYAQKTHNFGALEENGSASESSAAKNGEELSISYTWKLAMFMARQGFEVFPLKKRAKTPLFCGWQDEATCNVDVILKWAERYPDHNYGVLTGNGWFVLDFDLDKSEEIQRVQEKTGSFEPGTMVKTGRGDQLYCYSDGFDIRNNNQKRLSDKLDVKGAGGYVVGPGSIHPNGQRYEFLDPRTYQDGIKLTKLSEAALHYIVSLQGGQRAIGADDETSVRGANSPENRFAGSALDYAKPIAEGKRNDTLFRVGCYYREVHALQTNDLYQILKVINEHDCPTPLDDSELRSIAESCCIYPPGGHRDAVIESLPGEPCSEEVQDLFQRNKLIELFRKNVQKFHVGDWNVAELEILSVASQSVDNTDGIQPKLSGESGKGKTHVSRTVLHLLDPSMFRAASYEHLGLMMRNHIISYPKYPELIAELDVFKSDFTLSGAPDYSLQIAQQSGIHALCLVTKDVDPETPRQYQNVFYHYNRDLLR